MSAYTTKTVQEQAIEDMRRAFEDGRREAAVIITTPARTEVITQEEARSASALDTLQQMADQLASLKQRLEQAMDSVAISVGAFHCMECGEWATKSIPYGDAIFCPRCAPADVYCPF